MSVSELGTYASQSPITDPGAFAGRLDAVPADLQSLQRTSCRLVFHYRAGGDFAENGIAADRMSEIDTRYADAMFARLFALHDAPLTDDRSPHQRLVGCCRDFTVLFLALARHKGIPARARVGFAAYFAPGWYIDHEIAEVWDGEEQRWRLVDPELREGYVDPTNGAVIDPLDVGSERFIVGPQAWLACRAGDADPDRFVVSPDIDIPDLRSWSYLAHNLIHDLAGLNKREMVLWDSWGLEESEQLTDEQRALLDEVARAMTSPDVTVSELRDLYARDGFGVPAVVTSYSPATSEPLRVPAPRDTAPTTG